MNKGQKKIDAQILVSEPHGKDSGVTLFENVTDVIYIFFVHLFKDIKMNYNGLLSFLEYTCF